MLLFLLLATATAQVPKQVKDVKRIEFQLTRHLDKKSVPPTLLAPVIYKLARKYNVQQSLIVQVIVVESRGRADAYNRLTNDCGLAQLNKKTIALYHGDSTLLCNPYYWQQNLELGVKILSASPRACAYNVGFRFKNKLTQCLNYERKLASVF